MTPRHALSLALTAATLLLAAGKAPLFANGLAPAQIAYTTNGVELYSFDLATPGTVNDLGLFSGATVFLDGLDFRSADGQLYGYVQSTNQVVRVNTATAVTTLVSNPGTASSSNELGVDFNPVADRLRLVNTNDQNLRINVDTGATTVDTPLAYAALDTNFGANPNVIEAAYTNADKDAGTGTQLYYIDSGLDILATTSDPNGGVLNTVGPLGVGTSNLVGFDIFTSGGNNFAYAILDTGAQLTSSSLYSINLGTGQATLIGALVGGTTEAEFFFGLAITPLPEPGSLALLSAGMIGAIAWRRRKRGAV